MCFFLPPANEVCEDYVFTGVCLSTGRCLPYCMLGYTPIPPGPEADTPWADKPLGKHPPGQTSSPTQCMLGYGLQAFGMHPTGMHS